MPKGIKEKEKIARRISGFYSSEIDVCFYSFLLPFPGIFYLIFNFIFMYTQDWGYLCKIKEKEKLLMGNERIFKKKYFCGIIGEILMPEEWVCGGGGGIGEFLKISRKNEDGAKKKLKNNFIITYRSRPG